MLDLTDETKDVAQPPMANLALMYKFIEEHLRREELSLAALRQKDDISRTERTNWQVRDILKVLERHNAIIKNGMGREATYRWNPSAPPFQLGNRAKKAAVREPGEVAISRPHIAPEKMEVEFAGVVLTLGVNPITGLFRVIVDQKPPGD
jgi:hypothetical protein